jgi:hypothetical protein
MRMKPEIKDTDIIISMDGELPETKGIHPGPSEDSLARDLKKENIKVIEYPEEDED